MKNFIFALLLFTTACMQSRKGIKGTEEAWVWGAVDMCDTYPDCEYASTHLIGKLHFDSNMMEFDVARMPSDIPYVQLASDETVTYRLLAKRNNEGNWIRMKRLSAYENKKIGFTDKMDLSTGEILRVTPTVGYIEQYNRWILERVVTKGGKAPEFGLGTRLLDIEVQYAELEQ